MSSFDEGKYCGTDLSPGFRMPSSNIQFHGGGGGLGETTTTLDLFPLLSIKSINVGAEMELNHPEPEPAPEAVAEPLSIIYKGEMHVLDVPEVKAKQILEFANLQDFRRFNMRPGTVSVMMEPMSTIYKGEVNVLIDVPAGKGKEILDFARVYAGKGHYKCLSSKPSNIKNHRILSSSEPRHESFLPMERRYGMQRFVQRRKERITEKAPYQKGYFS